MLFLQVQEFFKQRALTEDDKCHFSFALAKMYEDIGKLDEAFAHLSEGNALRKKLLKYSINQDQELFSKLRNNLSDLLYSSLEIKEDSNALTPIFILGMPRSGTTLLEQVLSSHSKIHGAGELNYLPKIIDKFEINKPHNFENYVKTLRYEYHSKVSSLSNKQFIIDKLPMNFRWIGFIIKAFPEAKIIHIQRNPMAICWSNYKINFPDPGMDFSLSQKNTAEYYVLYNNLMKFWLDNLKNKIINIQYENFVNDFENETKSQLRLIEDDVPRLAERNRRRMAKQS